MNQVNFYGMKHKNLEKLFQHIDSIDRTYRERFKKSQFDFGLELGKSANQIGRIERAKSNLSIATLLEIAKY